LAPHVLVTGGAGFIGSHLTRRLLALGHKVSVLDNLSTGRAETLEALHAEGALCHHAELMPFLASQADEALARFDAVYHLAATVGVRLVVQDPLSLIDNNIVQTRELLRRLAPQKIPVLIASSSEVYGRNPKLPLRETSDLVYGPTSTPRWSYAMSKALDEYLALGHHRRDGLPAVIVRLFNTIGPGQVGRYGMVVPNFVAAAVAGGALTVHGDGQQSRAFCDVRDVVRALTELMREPQRHAGEVYNVGSDREITIEGLADLVIERAGGGRKRFVPYEQAYDERFEDMRRRLPDVTKIRDAIDFQAEIPLTQTIDELVAAGRGR